MAYSIEIRRLAAIEIVEAFDWYESQREGLGYEFLEDLESFYHQLTENPEVYSYYQNPVRQGPLERFPYMVVYEVHDAWVIVFSVFMTSRNPREKGKQ
jgi:hypothetical protein